jgi:hypothetical protein
MQMLQALIAHNHIEMSDALLQLRRLYSYLSCAPVKHDVDEAVTYLTSREALKIFNAETINVYLVPHYNNVNAQVFNKHSRSLAVPQVYEFKGCVSVATDVITKNQFIRLNSLHGRHTQSSFNQEVDGGENITVKRILCVPLHDAAAGRTIGVITFVNKTNGDVFTEVDDLFAEMFAEHATTHIVSCYEFERLNIRCRMLSVLLEASTDIFEVLPDSDSEQATVLPGSVLQTLERLAQNVLRCSKVRAFLCTGALGMPGDELIILEKHSYVNAHRKPPTTRRQTVNDITHIEADAGIVGTAVQGKRWLLLEGAELEMSMNASVDMDSLGLPMISVPIMTVENQVLACLQMVPGPQSPKFECELEGISQDNVTIAFEQALQWFLHQISHPLEYLLKYVGKPVHRPMSTPKPIKDIKGQRIRHSLSMRHEPGSPDLVSMSSFFGTSSNALVSSPSLRINSASMANNPMNNHPVNVNNGKLTGQVKALNDAVNDMMCLLNSVLQSADGTPRRASVASNGSAAPNLSTKQHSKTGLSQKDNGQSKQQIIDAKNKVEDLIKDIIALSDPSQQHGVRTPLRTSFSNTAHDFQAVATQESARPIHLDDQGLSSLVISTTVQEETNENDSSRQNMNVEAEKEKQREREEFEQALRKELEEKYEFDLSELLSRSDRAHADQIRELEDDLHVLNERYEGQREDIQQRDSTIADWARSYEEIKSNADQLQASLEDYMSRASESAASVAQYEEENAKLLQMQEELNRKIAEKDNILTILQTQLVQMAESNLADLDEAARKALFSSGTVGLGDMSSPPQSAPAPKSPIKSVKINAADNAGSTTATTTPKNLKSALKTPSSGTIDRTPSGAPRPPTTSTPAPRTPAQPKTPNPNADLGATRPFSVGQFAAGSFDPSLDAFGNSLPAHWAAYLDDSGSMYYYNDVTGESSWEPPAASAEDSAGQQQPGGSGVEFTEGNAVMVGDWQQMHDENGQEYWVNVNTGVSEWTLPASAQQVAYAAAGVTPKGTQFDSYKIEL